MGAFFQVRFRKGPRWSWGVSGSGRCRCVRFAITRFLATVQPTLLRCAATPADINIMAKSTHDVKNLVLMCGGFCLCNALTTSKALGVSEPLVQLRAMSLGLRQLLHAGTRDSSKRERGGRGVDRVVCCREIWDEAASSGPHALYG